MGTEEIQKAVEEEVKKRVDIETHDTSRVVKTLFTDKETITMARSLANCLREKARLESDLASVKKSFAGDIGKQDAEISALQEKLNTGWEMRRQDCIELRDYSTGNVTIYRKDLLSKGFGDVHDFPEAIIEERAMTFEERQMNLPITGKPGEVVDAEFDPESTSVTDVFGGTHEIAPQTTVADPPQDAEVDSQGQENDSGGGEEGEEIKLDGQIQENVTRIIQENQLPDDTHPFYADRPPLEMNGKGGKKGKKSLKLA